MRVAPGAGAAGADGARRASCGGDAAHAVARALARQLDERQPSPGRGAEGGDWRARARRRGAVGRRDPRRCVAARLVPISGQKWLCGPDRPAASTSRSPSAGARRPELPLAGGLRLRGRVHAAAGRRSASTPAGAPPAALAGLRAALDVQPEGRFERAAATAARCRDLLAERFDVVTAGEPATLVTFRAEEDTAALVRRLYDQGVVVRDIPGQGWIRVSCGWWTTDEDLERLLGGLHETYSRAAGPR